MATNGDWLAHKLLTLEQQVLALSRGTQLGNSSMQGTTLLMLDDEGLPKSELGPEGLEHLDGPVPPKPSSPILEQGIGTVFVRWDGLWAAEDDAEPVTTPVDFHVMEVHATTDPELDVWDVNSLAGTISQREGGVVMIKGWDIDDTVYVRLVCRTLADRVGESSEPAEVVIEGIDLAAIVEELDAANVDLANLDGTMFAANAELDALRIQFKNLDTSIINTDDGTLTEALEDARQALEGVKDTADDAAAKADAAQGAASSAETKAIAAQEAADAAQARADAIIARGDNLLINGGFERGWDGWATTGYSEIVEVPDAHSGAHVVRMGLPDINAYPMSEYVDTTQGRTYFIEAWFRRLTGGTDTSNVQFYTRTITRDGSTIGDWPVDLDGNLTRVNGATLPEGEWVRLEGYLTTAPDAVSVQFGPHVTRQGTQYDVDDVRVVDVTDSLQALTEAQEARADANAAAQAAATAQTTANGKNRITRSLSEPSSDYTGADGDLWWRLTTMGSDARVIGQWRWDGTGWQSEQLDDSVIATLNAAKLVAGTIDADRIGAASLTADKLLIGPGGNLLTNPGFLNNGAGWSGGNNTYSATGGKDGGGVLSIPDQDGTAGSYLGLGTVTYMSDIEPGVKYVIRGWVRSSEPFETSMARIFNRQYDVNGNDWSWPADGATSQLDGPTVSVPANEWFPVTKTFTADEGWPKASIGLYRTGAGNGADLEWSALSMRPMTPAVLIEDGAVTADKVAANAIGARAIAADAVEAGKIAADAITGREIAANSIKAEQIVGLSITADELAANSISTSKIVASAVVADKIASNAITTAKLNALAVTADKIAANAVTADKIKANAITAGKIDADAINGMTITGATVRTNASGARVEMNAAGISSWNSLGTRTFNVDRDTGQVEAVGSIFSGLPGQQRVVIDDRVYQDDLTIELPDGSVVPATGAGIIFGREGVSGASGKIGYRAAANGSTAITLVGPVSSSWGSANLHMFDNGQAVIQSGRSAGELRLFENGQVRMLSGGKGGGEVSTWPTGVDVKATGGAEVRLFDSGTAYMQSGSRARVAANSNGAVDVWARGSGTEVDIAHVSSSNNYTARMAVAEDRIDFTAGQSLVFSTGGGGDLALSSDRSNPFMRSRAVMNRTYSYAANMYVTTSGILGKSTSARRYKTDEQEIAPAEYADALLSIPFKSWLDKAQLEQHAELEQFRKDNPYCPTPEYLAEAEDEVQRAVGAVAEDFIDAGLEQFVTFDQYGRVDGLQYDRVGVALLPIVKGMKEQIDRLEAANGIGE